MDILFSWFTCMNFISKFTYAISGILLAILYTAYLIGERRKKAGRSEKEKGNDQNGK